MPEMFYHVSENYLYLTNLYNFLNFFRQKDHLLRCDLMKLMHQELYTISVLSVIPTKFFVSVDTCVAPNLLI